MTRLVGYGVSQVPTNGMLGGMAYQDPINVTASNITVSGGVLNVGLGGTIITTTTGGSVGIGLTNPSAKLDVNGIVKANILSLSSYAAVGSIVAADPGSNYYSWNNRIGSGLAVAGTTYLDGSVGIGTASPSQILHVKQTANRYFYYTSSGNIEVFGPETGNDANYVRLGASYNQLGLYASNTMYFNTSSTGGYIFGQDGVEKLRITSSGNIGINSTSPARKLDVVDSGASGSVVRSRVTTNNGGYLAYEALNSSGTSVFSVTHNGRINLSDNIVFASGQGIDFSATANSSGTMTSELLSDYEEGTWTPFMGTDASNTITHTTQVGRYTKIGNIVFIECYVAWSAWTGSGNVYLTNLPFLLRTASNSASTSFPVCASATTGIKNYQFRMDSSNANTSTIYLYNFENTAFTSISTVGTNSHVVVRGHYQVP